MFAILEYRKDNNKSDICNTMSDIINTQALTERLTRALARAMERESREAFRVKAWDGKPWRRSILNANTLIDSSALANSLLHAARGDTVIVYSRLPYANIHNEGGVIKVTERMRRYFWAMYYKTKDPTYKAFALTKKRTITIPKRQYVGITRKTEQAHQEAANRILGSMDLLGAVKIQIKQG